MTRVLHLNSLEYGGAAIAARRLHDGLRQIGHDSRFLFQHAGPGPGIEGGERLDIAACQVESDPRLDEFFELAYRSGAAAGTDVLFSTDRPTRDLREHPLVRWADVINLHWLSGMVSAVSVGALQSLGKPVVWTLHDQFPFTGGCHYSGTCEGYQKDCGGCPLLRSDVASLPRLVLKQKQRWIDPSRLTAVSPSKWLASRARTSALFAAADIRVIPNGVPVDLFQGMSRQMARTRLGVEPGATMVLFGADNLAESRKGFADLSSALQILVADRRVSARIGQRSLVFASFGNGSASDTPLARSLGQLTGQELIAAYRAADLFVLPSLEDNLPNTMLEAVAAGTPVIAYATGGIVDVVGEGGCGVLVPRGDVAALAEVIATLSVDHARLERLRPACEDYARTRLSLTCQADAYAGLYEELRIRRSHLPLRVPGSEPFTAVSLSAAEERVSAAVRPLDFALRQGAELSSVRAELEQRTNELHAAYDGWRESRETLHDVQHRFEHAAREVSRLEGELQGAYDGWRVSRETVHDVQQRLQVAVAEAAAAIERAAAAGERVGELEAAVRAHQNLESRVLRKTKRRLMKRAAIYGTADAGRRAWEALAQHGAVEIAGFIDDNPFAVGKTFLGLDVQPLFWANTSDVDVIVIASLQPDHCQRQLAAAGVAPGRILLLPIAEGTDAIARAVRSAFPDPLIELLAAARPGDAVRVGVFGTGAAAMKVWEALAEIDTAETVWFADNNPQQQGRQFLWVSVVDPALIPTLDYDAIVIGSMSRQPIVKQLRALGVRSEHILTPDVQSTIDQIRDQLIVGLSDLVRHEVAG